MTEFPARAICLVTDRRRLAPSARTTAAELAALEAQLDEAVGAAVDFIQIRERDVEVSVLVPFVRRIVRHAAASAVRVLVNDRADVALATRAHGVHLRSDSPPTARVRALEPAWVLGRSVHAGETISRDSGDFLVFGPVYETASKPRVPAAGLQALRAAAAATSSPVLAIGGVTIDRAAECVRHGARGIAAIGLFLPAGTSAGALGPARATEALRREFRAR